MGSRQARICYRALMSTERTKWRADRGSRALKRLAEIEASIIMLADEDLLDLADIFAEAPRTPLAEIAATEVAKRKI